MPDHPPASRSNDSTGETGATALRTQSTANTASRPAPTEEGSLRLAKGMVLADRLEIGDLLGSGGMGVVFEAFDRLTRDTVAVKVLREDLHLSAEAKARFLAEARVSRNLSHPHIVRVHDVGAAGAHHFLTMERLRGASLREHIQRRKHAAQPFTLTEVLDIGRQLIDALAYANHYIVHRDVKPENVWLGEDGSLKLMDFGIARIFNDLRDTRFVVGTPYYMAPEQRHDPENVTWAADMYAVGVILYELLTGAVPEGALLPPRVVRKDVRRSLSHAVLTSLAPSPTARFASWDDFKQELTGATVRTRATTLIGWAGIGTATLLFVLGAAFYQRKPRAPAEQVVAAVPVPVDVPSAASSVDRSNLVPPATTLPSARSEPRVESNEVAPSWVEPKSSVPAAAPRTDRYFNATALRTPGVLPIAVKGDGATAQMIIEVLGVPLAQRAFTRNFFTDGLFSRALRGDASAITAVAMQRSIARIVLLEVEERRPSRPPDTLGAIKRGAAVRIAVVDARTGEVEAEARFEAQGIGYEERYVEESLRDSLVENLEPTIEFLRARAPR